MRVKSCKCKCVEGSVCFGSARDFASNRLDAMTEAAGVMRNQSGVISTSPAKDFGPLDFTGVAHVKHVLEVYDLCHQQMVIVR